MQGWIKGLQALGLRTGTTTIGLVCEDGVVLATDTRVTSGFYIAHKRGKKVFPIDDHVAMTMAGVAAHGQNVVEILRVNARLYRLNHGRPMPISATARLAANLLFGVRPTSLIIQAIIGGVDDMGPRLYALDPFGSATEEKCFSTGSGSPIAYGLLEAEYRDGLTVEEGALLAVRAVSAAMKRDIASGDSFDVAIVRREGYRELSEEEKARILVKVS